MQIEIIIKERTKNVIERENNNRKKDGVGKHMNMRN